MKLDKWSRDIHICLFICCNNSLVPHHLYYY